MRIQTNVSALNAWRNLALTDSRMAKSLERLSSGLRINRAADDAAGLAISEKMRAQIRGLNQAIRNAQDGISLLQTAEGALNEYHAILQRMRELATQAANETLTDQDRAAIQEELNQLIREADRIATTTEFNRHALLDGSFRNRQLHIGANTNQVISFSIGSLRVHEVGAAWAEGKAIDTNKWNFAQNGLVINGVTIDLSGATSMPEVLARINAQSELTGVTASQVEKTQVNLGTYTAPATPTTLSINGIAIQVDSTVTSANQLADRINQVASKTGVTASVDSSGALVLTDSSGSPITVRQSGAILSGLADTNPHTFEAALRLAAKPGTASVTLDGLDAAELGLPVGAATGSTSIGTGTLTVTANGSGTAFNGLVIEFVDDNSASISAAYDGINKVTVKADWDGPSGTVNIGGTTGNLRVRASRTDLAGLKIEFVDDSSIDGTNTQWSVTYAAGVVTVKANWSSAASGAAPANLQAIQDKVNQVLSANGFTGMVSMSATGYAASEFAGTSVTLSVPPSSLAEIQAAINNALANTPLADGVTLNLTGAPYDAADFAGKSVQLAFAGTPVMQLSGYTVNTVDVRTVAGAETAVTTLDYAIRQVSEQRSALGALQNRLEHTVVNLQVAAENLAAAESRIRDADMAAEMMEFVRNQILLQSGTAMLAQANARPQAILQLLA